jgi:chemosensory pili system protein ChpC
MKVQRQTEPEVRGLVAPTACGDLILPTAAVAEVVAYAGEARVRPSAPDWLLGDLEWRGQRVPLIDLGRPPEWANPEVEPARRRQHCSALICHTPSGNRTLPYVGLLVAAAPRLVRLRAADLTPAADDAQRPFALCHLEYLGSPAWIPDLDRVEREGLRLGLLDS